MLPIFLTSTWTREPGVGVLVAAHDLTGGPVGVRQAVEVGGPQDAVDGRGRDPGAGSKLDGALTQAHAQRDDPLDHRLGYGGGGTSADGWSGRSWAGRPCTCRPTA